MDILTETNLPFTLFSRGKVRDTYELDGKLLMVATDRLSAFDVVFREGVPLKGAVLTQLSDFWFGETKRIIRNHVVSVDVKTFGAKAQEFAGILGFRSMLVEKTVPVKAECVVRGYLAGSAWKEYKEKGSVCGIKLQSGLKESDVFPEPLFTPSTKGEVGQHDINISVQQLAEIVGKDDANELEEASLKIYEFAARHARKKGIIIADTKFEFGKLGGEMIWIDEALTPDSSRFWPADKWEPGKAQPSFDKQPVRDYLEAIGWNKSPPPPPLPKEVIEDTTKRYVEAYERITGKKFPV